MSAVVVPNPSPAPPDGKLGPDQETARTPAIPDSRAGGRRLRIGVRPTDVLLPLALVLWMIGVQSVRPAAMNDYGLFPALPVVFYVGVVLLVGSIVMTLLRAQLSPVRLGLHLAALVVVLHGTIPLIFTLPNYAWVYKHVGVVRYMDLHGGVDASVDIYHNWPGFFALATWFTRVAGVGSPLTYAAWAPVYFNLLICLELAFVYRFLPLSRRVRWLALFLFVAANWVGQDYFSPQAITFVLSLAVFGMVLAWFQVDRPPAAVRAIRRLASRLAGAHHGRSDEPESTPPPSPLPPPSRIATVGVLFATFAVIVISHQLSPYLILLGLGLLTVAGIVRPLWLVVGLAAAAVGYLLLHLAYVEQSQDLLASLGDPLGNILGQPSDSVPMEGRRLTALAAPAIVLGIWGLGMLGVLRRLWARRKTLALVLLAAAPGLAALAQSYGGEVVFRIYLFSLPWIAVLAASALDPRPRHRPLWSAVKVGVVLSVTVALFMSAFFGSEELYMVRPGEAAASQYFYDHAEAGSVLTLAAPNFPSRVGERYDQFRAGGDNLPDLLTTGDQFRHRMLGPADLPAISTFVEGDEGEEAGASGSGGGRYLVLTTGQDVYARVLGLSPPGSMAGLDRALAASPNWSVYYRNRDAVIYRSLGSAKDATPPVAASPAPPVRTHETSRDWAAMATGVVGMGLVAVVWRRRRAVAGDRTGVILNEEETMRRTHATNGPHSEGASDGDSAPEPEPEPVTVPVADADELLRQAMLEPASEREPFRLALSSLEPEPARFRGLVTGVEPARRPDAVRLLGEAWGPVPSAQIRPLLDHVSGPVRAAAVAVLDRSPEAAAELRRILRNDPSSAVRVAAIRALAGAPEADQLAALSVAVADPEPEVRTLAIEMLPVAGSGRATSSVFAASEDSHEQVRLAAYRRLAGMEPWRLWMAISQCSRREELCAVLRQQGPDDRLTALVLERMSSPEPGDRILAVELAGRLETPGRVDETVDALDDPEAAVRGAAAGRLHGCGEACPALVAALQDDPEPAVRTAAAAALDGVEDDAVLPAFIAALQDPEVDVQRIATEALVRRSSYGLADRLAAGLTVANSGSVGQVLLRMGNIGEDALVAAAVDGPSDRSSAAAALLRKTGKVKTLLWRLRAVDPPTRLRAVDALGAVGGPDAVDGLVAALWDPWPAIRSRAAFHLGSIGDQAVREPLQQLSDRDQVVEVRTEAREALRLIDERPRHAARSDGT